MASKALSAPGSARVIERRYSCERERATPQMRELARANSPKPRDRRQSTRRARSAPVQKTKGADMPTTTNNRFDDLAIKGRVVYPTDPEWDVAHQAFSTLVDQRPDAMVFPADADDVVTIVNYARERGVRIAPQATAHNAGPLGELDETIVVQTSEMTDYSIDPAAHRVRVGSGIKWEKITPDLSNQGLAGLHGSSPDVGIAGYSLGGGMGWLARKYGLQTNSVTAIELVTADGEIRRVTAENEPDLFWALRGGGGNFGIVTAIEFA